MSGLAPLGRDTFLEDEDLDLTPLIDCVFQLLVFFMLCTAFYAVKGLEVVMPGTATAGSAAPVREIQVYLTASGEIQVEGRPVALAGLAEAFTEAVRVEQTRTLVLEAANQVEHERVIQVVDRAKAAGIEEINFAWVEEGASGP
jgi:biopolymer transport protein ExbD